MTAASAAVDDLPKLEKYELIEEIGHGGMATVYRARDLRLGREVAVKIIHRHLRDNREVATRFLAEARAAAKLKHKGIVEVYDVSDEAERERYLVVELVPGQTLRQLLVAHRDMPAEIGAMIVVELCDAIEHAHASGIIHRDIKPENVLVGLPSVVVVPCDAAPPERDPNDDPTKSGPVMSRESLASDRGVSRPPTSSSRTPKSGRNESVVLKITDFGIAKILDAHGVTSTGQVLGSPAHMAPEQIEAGEVDARTDVFALGVILYECLVGHLPFDGKNPAQVLRRVLDGKYARADTERATIGGRFSEIIDRALALDPKDRPETPTALAALLIQELDELGLTERGKELAAYFAGPEAYAAKLQTRLVSVLIGRGEAARRSKRMAMAACDFNRAHALAPDDVLILKRMTQLSSATRQSRLFRGGVTRKLAIVGVGSLFLGGMAYGGVRLIRDAQETPLEATPEVSQTAPAVEVARPPRPPIVVATPTIKRTESPADSTSVSASASTSISASTEVATNGAVRSGHPLESPSAGASGSAAPDGTREVIFQIKPRTASLAVDGSPVTPGQPIPLTLGEHSIMITAQAGDTSSDPWASPQKFLVKAPKEGESSTLWVRRSLKWRPVTLTLVGAPADGEAHCGVQLKPNTPVTVQLLDPDKSYWSTTCKFMQDGRSTTGAPFDVAAGTSKNIGWIAP